MMHISVTRHLVVLGVVFITLCINTCDGASWPAAFQSSTWLDSSKGTLVFTTTGMTGYSIEAYSTAVSSWECLDKQYFDTDGTLLIKSTTSFSSFGGDFWTYLCLQFTKLSDASYRYYHIRGQQPNAGQARVHISLDAGITSKDTICSTTRYAEGAAFSVMVKQGSESTAYKQCPTPLLGRFTFDYTNKDNTALCNDASNKEHMNVCTDKTKVAFDIACTGQSIVYAAAEVHCVDSVSVGTTTFVQLYNPGTVDSSTTYRFSCMAISEDSLTATVVYNNCTDNMTPTTRAKRHDGITIGASITFAVIVFCKGGCSWPSGFPSTTWHDNTHGDITFTATTMSGWSFVSYSSTISNWECLDATYFDSEGILILKATDTFDVFGSPVTSYLCLKMTKITDASYYYYQKHVAHPNAANERVKINAGVALTTKAEVCDDTAVIHAAEFHVMIKSGSESTAKQWCAPALLAKMDYSHTAADGTVTCDSSTDNWDVCTDRMMMTFDYTKCTTEMAYSTAGNVWCVANLTSSYQYQVVYNTDASPTYRFACFVVLTDGTKASMVYNNCTENQTPTTLAKAHDGTAIGATLTMNANETCPFLETTTTTASTGGDTPAESASSTPIIAGAAAGGLLIILALIAIIIYCIIKKKHRVEVFHADEDNSQ